MTPARDTTRLGRAIAGLGTLLDRALDVHGRLMRRADDVVERYIQGEDVRALAELYFLVPRESSRAEIRAFLRARGRESLLDRDAGGGRSDVEPTAAPTPAEAESLARLRALAARAEAVHDRLTGLAVDITEAAIASGDRDALAELYALVPSAFCRRRIREALGAAGARADRADGRRPPPS